ncbi:hypothetical protein FB451DRAFT_1094147 [Mycena latifolia]|nr:hypothetical protein FB451DRAFT_1094147 [Mycena latifolia]
MDSDAQTNPQEVEGLWFSSDLVILKAGNRLFRVFTSILKEKSPIFADMFGLPQPVSTDVESIGGVPVILMHDDPVELEAFLKAIFDSNYFMPPPATTDIDTIVGVLRLAHKYDVHFLRRRALEHLGTLYSTYLEDYNVSGHLSFTVESILHINLKTIQIAVEVGALWLLPDAYHTMHQENLQTVMATGALWDCLGEAEKTNCFRVFSHDNRIRPTIQIVQAVSTESSKCRDSGACNIARMITLQNHDWYDTADALVPFNWYELKDNGLCETCLKSAKAMHESARQKFWDELPGMFGLPRWDELEEMRETALA